MNSQQLEYVRQQLIVATADMSGATKGQLVAFAENAQFTATARSRGRKKVTDPVTGRKVNPDGPAMSGSQSRAKGSSIALVSPVEFGTASWRRAVLSLEEHQKAWLLWNYSENNSDDEFDDIIIELPPPWASWLDIVVTGYPDGRDPESLPKVP